MVNVDGGAVIRAGTVPVMTRTSGPRGLPRRTHTGAAKQITSRRMLAPCAHPLPQNGDDNVRHTRTVSGGTCA